MEKGILIVETHLSSPELAEEFHRVYNDVHLKEMVALDGYRAARRYEPLGHEGAYVAIYDLEADDLEGLEAARLRVTSKLGTGELTTPPGVATDPRPVVRFFRLIATEPGS